MVPLDNVPLISFQFGSACHEHVLRRPVVDTDTAKGVVVGVGGGCVCEGGE